MSSTIDERLPTPKLDDRRFQDLVDEAKRRVQQRCPEWTDHNVSDPGVTLIETFAWMTDQLLYRLNRVPDLNYIKFLELIGITLLPPTAANVDVTFRLSKAQDTDLVIPASTQISTPRSASGEQITFATSKALSILPCKRQSLASTDPFGGVRRHDDDRFVCFSDQPQPGDAFLVGLDQPVPSCTVSIDLPCKQGAGGGIAPDDPPIVWDARVGDDEGAVHLWNKRTRELVRRFAANRGQAVHRIAFSPDGHMLASAGGDGTIWVRDAHEIDNTGRRLDGHEGPVLALAFNRDGDTLASAGDDGTVQLWDLRDENAPSRALAAHDGPVFAVTYDRSVKSMLATAGADGMVRLWDTAKDLKAPPDHEWDVHEHREPETPKAPAVAYRRCPLGVAFLEDGRVAAAGDDGAVWLWDPNEPEPEAPQTGAPRAQPPAPKPERHVGGHRGPIFGVGFSPNGRMLATAGSDGTVRLWDVEVPEKKAQAGETGLKHALMGHQGPVHAVVFNPDADTLATVGSDWTARLWSVESGEQLERALSSHCPVNDAAFHPTGELVATAGIDGGWARCEVERDGTKGLNEHAEVLLHVPDGHRMATIGEQSAGWLRCRVRAARQGQAPYDKSPVIDGTVTAATLGGTVGAVNAETVLDEVLGVSEGVAGQRFPLERRPVVPLSAPETHVLEVLTGERAQKWHQVATFADAGEGEQCFMIDHVAGEVVLGPTVREPGANGAPTETYRTYGAVPHKGAELRLRKYLTGGGRRGNVKERTLTVLRSPIANVSYVENRRPASGGVDGEDIENAKVRGPITLRTANRAVTPEDYEQLTREAAPELARVECIQATNEENAGEAHVLVIPKVESDDGELRFEQLVPAVEMINRIKTYLDERRVIGTRVLVTPPNYHGITIAAKLLARREFDSAEVRRRTLEALYTAFSPISGGRDGTGWEFGRDVLQGDVYAVLQSVRGVDRVEDCRIFEANPINGERTLLAPSIPAPGEQPRQIQVVVSEYATVFSYRHYVYVESQ